MKVNEKLSILLIWSDQKHQKTVRFMLSLAKVLQQLLNGALYTFHKRCLIELQI
jgi:hypothetical protein